MSEAEQRERERWPLIMKFDVLETLLCKCKLWFYFLRGCVDSEKKLRRNGTKRTISHRYRALHLLSHTWPPWTPTLSLTEGLLLDGGRSAALWGGIGPFFTEPPATQATLNRSLTWKLLFVSPAGTVFENERGCWNNPQAWTGSITCKLGLSRAQ